MKSIARLIVAIPTLVLATQTCVSGQQFPSTTHGSFDGSVVEIPEATLSLPNIGGGSTNRTPAPNAAQASSGINQVGGYQTVMDPNSAIVLPASVPQAPGSGSRVVLPSGSGTSSAPIITVDPANVSQPTRRSAPLPSQGNQTVIVEQAAPQFVQGGQTYIPSEGEVFFEEGQVSECQSCNQGVVAAPSSAAVGEDFFIQESQIEPVAVQGAAPRVRRRQQRVQRRVASQPRQPRRTPGARRGGRVLTTAGASALFFNRNDGDNRNFATNGNSILSSENNEFNTLPGVDAFFSRRRVSGIGWEARYFGLFPADTSTQVNGNSISLQPGLSQLGSPSNFGRTSADFFNLGNPQVLTRQTEIHNFEANLLRNAIPRLRATQTEFLIGFRYLKFDETLLHEAIGISSGTPGFGLPESAGYFSTVENELLGIQFGARSDYQISRRLALHFGVKVGAFNNRINTRQRVDYRLPDGSVINPSAIGGSLSGQRFDIGSGDEVKSLLGEVDASVSLQVTNAARLRVGYRGIGVTDVAFASDQIGDDFNDANALLNPDTDGTLVLQGTYVGLEFAF